MTESVLDPKLADFCTRLHITPEIREFHDDEDNSDPHPYVSDQSSDIDISYISDKDAELRRFIGAFQTTSDTALTRGNTKKRGRYSKCSKKTLKRRKQAHVDLASKGFLPVDEYIRRIQEKRNRLTSELDTSIDGNSEVESGGTSPVQSVQLDHTQVHHMESEESSGDDIRNGMDNVQQCLTRHAPMESEESSGGDDGNEVGDCARQSMSENDTSTGDDMETLTARNRLEGLRHKAILEQEKASQGTPNTFQILGDHSRLREASAKLTQEAKRDDLDAIVLSRIAAMIGLLNLYTDKKMSYTWTRASEVVAKTQGRGTNQARHIREWAIAFLKQRALPLHRLNWRRPILLDDEDIAQELKSRLVEKVGKGFLKAEDVVEVVASQEMQAVFAQKGISKVSISIKTALRWLEKLGWRYGKLKNGMYLDGHERSDVVEYRQSFVERWMGFERRFHRWNHDGTELPRPIGFPVPGAIGRFRLVLITHDESTFFQNNERNTGWTHASSKSKPKAKGNGQTLMVSDFLTPDWG